MSNTFASGDIKVDENNVPYMNKKPVEKMVHVLHQHFSALEVGTKYTCLFSTDERHMVNGINNLYGTDFTWNKLDSKTHEFFNPVAAQPFTRLKFSHVGDFYVAQVVVDPNLQIEGAKPSTEIGEMLSKETRPKFDTAYFASRDKLSILTSFIHTSFSTRHMSFSPSRDIDSAFLALGEDKFLTPVVLNNYRNNGGYSTLLFKNEVLPAIELDINVYSKARVAVVLGSKLGLSLTEDNFVSDDLIHAFDPYTGVNEEYTIFRLTRGEEVKYMAAVTAVDIIVKPTDPIDPTDPVEPVDPETPVDKPLTDLSLVTNNDMPGVWKAEVDKYSDLDEEGNTVGNDILESVLAAINLVSDTTIGFEDLSMILGDDYRITVTAATGRPIAKVKGKLVVAITEKVITPPEEPVSQVDLSQITNHDVPGEWYVEVASEEERESEYDNIIASVLVAINAGSEQNVTLEDLVIYTDSSNNTFVASVTEDDAGKVIGTLVVKIKVVIQEEPSNYGPTGLRANYPGTGWYKATDTGTVFCKGVPALETCVFEVDGLEYVSTYSEDDIKLYGARAATSNVTNISALFSGASTFNEDIGSWDTSNVTNMNSLFDGATAFNQDISKWDVSNVVNMGYMFYSANSFNQDLSGWCVSKLNTMPGNFDSGSKLTAEHLPVWGTCPRHEDGSVPVESTPKVDLSKITNSDTPGDWFVEVDSDEAKDGELDDIINTILVAININSSELVTLEDLKIHTDSDDVIHISSITGDNSGKVINNLRLLIFVMEKPPEEPVSQVDLSQITNNDNPGSWVVEVASNEEREAEYDNVIASVLIAINEASKQVVTLEDLVIYTDSSNNTIVTSVTGDDDGKVVGTLVINIKVKPPIVPEEPSNYGPTGLKADYPGTGWYKATDTGTVFNKGVPALETHVFEEGGLEYVSVHTKEDALLYGERAATSNITDMNSTFYADAEFNSDISSWDVSSVTDMGGMFQYAYAFNQDLSSWDTSRVTNMRGMFNGSTLFNQDLSSWDVSSVTDMGNMFYSARAFNSDISSWDVGSVTDMNSMLENAFSFNQDLSEWCVILLPTKPDYFDSGTSAWTLPRPVWGTCPGSS